VHSVGYKSYSFHAGEWRPADERLVKKVLAEAQPGAQVVRDAPSTVLLGKTVEELQELVSGPFGQPKYRGKQVYDALFHGVTSVHDIKQVHVCLLSPVLPSSSYLTVKSSCNRMFMTTAAGNPSHNCEV
jgi:hypothetical protein